MILPKTLFSVIWILVLILTAASGSPNQVAVADHHEEDFQEEDSIPICCYWGDELADGELTYKIKDSGDSKDQQALRDALEEWDTKITGLRLIEISGDKKESDIEIKFRDDGEDIAGQAVNNFDVYGLIDKVMITVSQSAYGNSFDTETLEHIAKHEMGHALGLGHANFEGNLMTALINDGTATISECEIDTVLKANQWKLIDKETIPHAPSSYEMEC
jgi:hypothetical protein